jgi:hypothetical protein
VICLDSGWTTLLDAMVSLTFTSFDNYEFSMLCDLLHFAPYAASKRGHPRVASFSAASFTALHSSVRYLIFFYTLLATVYFVVSRRCMMQPIIFLLLIVVRLTQKIFFPLVCLPFSF